MPLDLETTLTFSLTAIACLVGAIIDVRTRRIPNAITFSAIVVLLALHGGFSGLAGLKESALGLTGGFLVMLIPHLFGVLGAGDVKLMAAVGAGLGSSSLFTVVLFTSLAGGLQIVLWMAWVYVAGSGKGRGYRICYGPAIAAGAMAAMALVLAGEPYLSVVLSDFF